MNLPKAIFFDWDGTLADSYAFLESAHNHVLQTLGKPPLAEGVYVEYFGKPREVIYGSLYKGQEQEAQGVFDEYVKANHAAMLRSIEGADELLAFLRGAGVAMGVVTNKKGYLVRAEIEAFGWNHYFVSVVGAGEAGADKPSPAPLIKAAAGFGPDIWFAGDTEADLQCAESYGCPVVFINNMPNSAAYLGDYNPVAVVKNCAELHDFLLQSAKKAL